MPSALRGATLVVAWCVLIGLLASTPASFAQNTATARPAYRWHMALCGVGIRPSWMSGLRLSHRAERGWYKKSR